MDLRFPSGLLNNLLPDTNRAQGLERVRTPETLRRTLKQDRVDLSTQQQTQTSQEGQGANSASKQTRLISEQIEKIDNGFRRTQQFEDKEGRPFTKIEEFTTTADRARRTVIQQNSSGSTTVLEDILDRQNDGSFRLTRRFTDEAGDVSTDVQFNIKPLDADVLLGREPSLDKAESKPFQPLRGTEFDIET